MRTVETGSKDRRYTGFRAFWLCREGAQKHEIPFLLKNLLLLTLNKWIDEGTLRNDVEGWSRGEEG